MAIVPNETEIEIVVLSLRVALWAALGGAPVALGTAWLLARRQFPGKLALDAVVHLPLVLPPVVVGYGLLLTFGRHGALGNWLAETFGIVFAFNWRGAALAAAVMGFPLMVRAFRLSLDAVDPGLEAAARTLGAGQARVFAGITLPLAMPGLLAGLLLGFARSLGEFGATITFVSNIPGETRTLPLAIYALTQVPGGDEGAIRLCALSVALALIALALSEIWSRRVNRTLSGVR